MPESLASRTAQFEADVELAHQLIHGTAEQTVATDNGDLRTFAGALAEYDSQVAQSETAQSRAAAEAAAADASSAQALAETARDAAQLSAGVFADTSAGLAATTNGKYFSVPSADAGEYLILYKNNAGSPVETKRYPSAQAIADIGIESISAEANDLAWALTDQDKRTTWLQVGRDGLPTAYTMARIGDKLTGENAPALVQAALEDAAEAVGLESINADANDIFFGIADSSGALTELVVGRDGRFPQRVIDSIAARLSAAQETPIFPIPAWACWGDSLTAAGWPTTLATLSNMPAYNGGWGGQGYGQIAARQGGVPARLTVSGDAIPASGPVAVTATLNNPLSDGGSRQGTLAGVLGLLAMAGGALTFTRSISGDAVSCPASSYFTPADGTANEDRHVTIWSGRNSFNTADPALIVASISAMIAVLTPRVKRVVVMSIPPWVGEDFGTPTRIKLDACNQALQAAFPDYWLDIAGWLRTDAAATAAGVTFTSEDQTNIANGLTPASLRSDGGHLNAAGNSAIAARVYLEAQNRGWVQ